MRESKQERLWVYRFLQWFLRQATRIFFRRIEVTGREMLPNPLNSAVIFCGNHPNSLLDPVLMTAWCGRIVHFAAKDVLFSVPVLGQLLRLMGAVPIRRRMDHGGGKQSNDDAFRDLRQVLFKGRAMGIFPEGISHDESQLAPLKTGAARIALGARDHGCPRPVYIVPVGLVYFTRHRFRSSVLLQFGAPILIHEGGEAHTGKVPADTDKEEVRKLTDEVEQRLRGLTINAETWEQLWVLDGVRRLYQPKDIALGERARLAQRFNEGYPRFKDKQEVRELYDRVRDYLLRLSANNLDDSLVEDGISIRGIALRIIGHLTLLFVSLPLFLIGAPVFLPLGILLKLAGVAIAPRSDTVATTKFLGGFLLVPLLYALAVGATFWFHGIWWALAVFVLVPASGGSVIHVISRFDALRHLALTTWRVLRLRKELEDLQAERAALADRVQVTVDHYRDLIKRQESGAAPV